MSGLKRTEQATDVHDGYIDQESGPYSGQILRMAVCKQRKVAEPYTQANSEDSSREHPYDNSDLHIADAVMTPDDQEGSKRINNHGNSGVLMIRLLWKQESQTGDNDNRSADTQQAAGNAGDQANKHQMQMLHYALSHV